MHLDRRQEKNHRIALGALALLGAAPAFGQTSASLTLLSEYSARGVALDTRPTPQLRLVHDTDGGWYGGGFASSARLEGRRQAQFTVYGGRARQLGSTLSVDAGFSRSTFSRARHLGFTEFYAGMTHGRLGARLFYSPAYYGEGRTLYLDLNGACPLGDKLSLSIHGGFLRPVGSYEGAHDAADARIALATELGDYRLQAGLQAAWHPYLEGVPRARALFASATVYF
jgi:uncharacterized protein (TIGR02001 family)